MTTKETVGASIGIDWANEKHECALFEHATGRTTRVKVANTAEALHEWTQELKAKFGNVRVALESGRHLLLNVLRTCDWIEIYPVHPEAAANYRKAFSPSGAKDDPRDAAALLDMLISKHDQLRVFRPMDGQSRLLENLCKERRAAVDQRTKLVQKLDAKLKAYFPQARQIAGGDLTLTMACDFIIKYPDLQTLKRARRETLKKFFYQHNSRSNRQIEKRLDTLEQGVPATNDDAVIVPLRMAAVCLARQIKGLNTSIKAFEKQILAAFSEYPDRNIFESLPGAGSVLAPRLAAVMGLDRDRYQDAAEIQCHSGIAPLTEASGKRMWVHRRWRCPKFQLQTFHEYADQSLRWSPWAKAYYQMCRHRDKNAHHNAIIRSLAFKWIRIIYACWKTQTQYSEDSYQAQLRAKNSPICNFLPTQIPC